MKLKSFHRYKKPNIIANKTKKIFLSINELNTGNLLSYVCCADEGYMCCVSACDVCFNCSC